MDDKEVGEPKHNSGHDKDVQPQTPHAGLEVYQGERNSDASATGIRRIKIGNREDLGGCR